VPLDYTWRCHHAAVVNNVMDSTHVAPLHRQFRTKSFVYGPVTRCEVEGDSVIVAHDIEMNPEGLLWYIANRIQIAKQEVRYAYPHLVVTAGAVFKLWNFLLPVDARTTRVFMLACTASLKVPFTSLAPPAALLRPAIALARKIFLRPLFDEDGWSTEAEQAGYEQHWDRPAVDPHPATRLCYQLTVRKWEEHLRRRARDGADRVSTMGDVLPAPASAAVES
jgi:hypothetical protein